MRITKEFLEQRAKDRKEYFEKPHFYKWSERFVSKQDDEYGTITELSFIIQYITGQKPEPDANPFYILQDIAAELCENKNININWSTIYQYFDKRLKETEEKLRIIPYEENVGVILHTLKPYREQLTKEYATF